LTLSFYTALAIHGSDSDPLATSRLGETMARRWQFDLKAVLGVTAALASVFWMWTSDDASVRFWGVALLFPTIGGCVGYLLAGWAGVLHGICIAVLLSIAVGLFLLPLF